MLPSISNLICSLCLVTTLSYGKLCFTKSGVPGPGNTKENHAEGKSSPNFVFVLTDDQDATMGGLDPMTKAKELLGKNGASFTNAFVASPLCCPSRSSILTGRYVHNHGAVNNSLSGNCSSRDWQATAERKTFPVYMKQLGYRTFFAGKYLNKYGRKHVGGVQHIPPGWDDWHGLVGNSRYYNYTLSNNGKAEKHGQDYKQDYLTDVISRKAAIFLNSQSVEGGQPFFMMLSTPASHAPFTPAPQYANHFTQRTAPRSASFGRHSKDKHWLIRAAKHPLSADSVQYIDSTFRNRWRTLLSVDDMLENMVTILTKKKLLDNTYIVLTSDNGFHLGQFSLPNDKRQMYEFDIRVPFMIRGPGIAPGQVMEESVLNIDLAPTFIDLAGGVPPPTMDGRSLRLLLRPSAGAHCRQAWRSGFLIEHQGEHKPRVQGCPQYRNMSVSCCFPDCVCEDAANNTYSCLRLLDTRINFIYCQFLDNKNFVEAYDMHSDPEQLINIAPMLPPHIRSELKSRLEKMRACSGPTCADVTRIPRHLIRRLKSVRRHAR